MTPINSLLAQATVGQPTPTIGMGATILLWSDRQAATITDVRTKRGETYVTTQDDNARVTSGSVHDGSAVYEYSRNENGRIRHFKATGPGGVWRQIRWDDDTKRWNRSPGGGAGLRIGDRDEYRDPSF